MPVKLKRLRMSFKNTVILVYLIIAAILVGVILYVKVEQNFSVICEVRSNSLQVKIQPENEITNLSNDEIIKDCKLILIINKRVQELRPISLDRRGDSLNIFFDPPHQIDISTGKTESLNAHIYLTTNLKRAIFLKK